MAVVDGSFDFMRDTNEPLLCDLDHISSYDPSPINISNEAATSISTSEPEGPKLKKAKVAKIVTVVTTGSQLPEPCPLPIISERTKNIIANGIQGNKRFFLLREAVMFYEGICPNPTSEEYMAMANKTLCHEYPELKDKGNKYWESVDLYISQRYRNCRRYSAPKGSASVSEKKLVTASLASAVAPTSDTGMTPYERYVAVMTQLYEKKSISDNSHMMKLLQITHEVEAEFCLMCSNDATEKIFEN